MTDIIASIQRLIFEATAELGPTTSAILAGYAVIIFGELFLTQAGEDYLGRIRT